MSIGQERHEEWLEKVTKFCENEDLELIESEDDHYQYIVRDLDGFIVCIGCLAEIMDELTGNND